MVELDKVFCPFCRNLLISFTEKVKFVSLEFICPTCKNSVGVRAKENKPTNHNPVKEVK